MRSTLLTLLTACAVFISASLRADMSPEDLKRMHHVDPMPHLMYVVNQNKEALKLSEEQEAALKAWHQKNRPYMISLAEQVYELEKKLADEALAGAPGAVLQQTASMMFNVRGAIIKNKLACRNHLYHVLSGEQWDQVVELYKKQESDS